MVNVKKRIKKKYELSRKVRGIVVKRRLSNVSWSQSVYHTKHINNVDSSLSTKDSEWYWIDNYYPNGLSPLGNNRWRRVRKLLAQELRHVSYRNKVVFYNRGSSRIIGSAKSKCSNSKIVLRAVDNSNKE